MSDSSRKKLVELVNSGDRVEPCETVFVSCHEESDTSSRTEGEISSGWDTLSMKIEEPIIAFDEVNHIAIIFWGTILQTLLVVCSFWTLKFLTFLVAQNLCRISVLICAESGCGTFTQNTFFTPY